MSLLDTIDFSSPKALKKLTIPQLRELAGELREAIVATVSQTGGHLASNLGAVELTLAIHYCFDFPTDRLLWDVGHQCYVHKMITGRRGRFETIRQAGGLSGFPDINESEYDQFSVGHAGTAIATAVGLAHGDKLAGRSNRIVAVVGDASIVNGLSFEGLNNAGVLHRQLLVVLNDNSMAIDVTQGAFAKHLHRLRFTHTYEDLKIKAHHLLDRLPGGDSMRDSLHHLKQSLKSALLPDQIFEQLGITYLGPIDGHDLDELVRALTVVRDDPYPILLHVHTEKGRGSKFATSDPCKFHSPSSFKLNGDEAVIKKGRKSFTSVFGNSLVELAEADDKIVAITAAMPDGTGLVEFKERFPDRYFDVGICESAAVDIAAGLAKGGFKPVVAVYSTFLQRAFDQIWQEVILQGLPVVFAIDRAGLVGSDGAVHHGFADLALLAVLPKMVCCAVADELELADALRFAVYAGRAVAIRYPRDVVPDPILPAVPFELGRGRMIREGSEAVILACGAPTAAALQAAALLSNDGIEVAVASARFVKPIDTDMVDDLLARDVPVVMLEDHSKTGGFGSAVIQYAHEKRISTSRLYHVGLPADRLIRHDRRGRQLQAVGLDVAGIVGLVKKSLGSTPVAEQAKVGPNYGQTTRIRSGRALGMPK